MASKRAVTGLWITVAVLAILVVISLWLAGRRGGGF
ncbi:hypothetical protein GA0074695_5446 [Micromonospora viridifaciens]|uniref:Uncharacterized protein n=1 Tax=Micromonospora viridifaciens TaxID=1881 RepID=A0A1C4ZE11_MICVI|nr:hypothetical protein GA0074695_5446 [Micromonospora viridifaciens]